MNRIGDQVERRKGRSTDKHLQHAGLSVIDPGGGGTPGKTPSDSGSSSNALTRPPILRVRTTAGRLRGVGLDTRTVITLSERLEAS